MRGVESGSLVVKLFKLPAVAEYQVSTDAQRKEEVMVANRKLRQASGFTLIELLVVVIIIGILAAIALPNFIGAQDKAREASVKANMRTAQIAAESYATDNGGQYPPISSDPGYQTYLPGGSSDGVTPGNYPVNPFTNTNAAFVAAPITQGANAIQQARTTGGAVGGPGLVGYTAVASNGANTSYGIMGGNKTGNALTGTSGGTYLVLSNQ